MTSVRSGFLGMPKAANPDGSKINLVNGHKLITASGQFVVPEGVYQVMVIVQGGGAGAGPGNSTSVNSAGAAAGICIVDSPVRVEPGQVINCTIGAGGAGGAYTGGSPPGSPGGTTSFGAFVSAAGGEPSAGAAPGVNVQRSPFSEDGRAPLVPGVGQNGGYGGGSYFGLGGTPNRGTGDGYGAGGAGDAPQTTLSGGSGRAGAILVKW